MSTITVTTTKAKYPGNLADEYLALKSKQAELAKQEKELKERILDTRKDVIEGNFGRVAISHVDGGWKPDFTKAAKELIAADKLSEYQKWQSETIRFNVRARVPDAKVTA